jgi:hypothetical protein
MGLEPSRRLFLSTAFGVLGASWVGAWGQQEPAAAAPKENFPPPEPIQEATLGPMLKTHPIRRNNQGFVDGVNGKAVFNERWIDASVLPRDKPGIWVLNFAYKPLRITQVELPGKGRRDIHYLYYQVINRTDKPVLFVPQFTLITDTGKRYEDAVLPQAVKKINAREDLSIDSLYGAVDIMGMVPPSTKQGIDDAVFGVAVWDNVDPHADKFSVYVRGLSDGNQQITEPDGKATTKYKTLRIDYIRRGDQFDLNQREIQLLDPPYEWVYW